MQYGCVDEWPVILDFVWFYFNLRRSSERVAKSSHRACAHSSFPVMHKVTLLASNTKALVNISIQIHLIENEILVQKRLKLIYRSCYIYTCNAFQLDSNNVNFVYYGKTRLLILNQAWIHTDNKLRFVNSELKLPRRIIFTVGKYLH